MGSLRLVLPAPGVAQTPAARDGAPAQAEPAADEVEWQVSERGGGRRGGEVAVALTAEPRTYLPLIAVNAATQAVVDRIHASLVRRDGETLEIQPALASSWAVSPDHRQLTLELRRGVRFSDGEPFDADDVVFTLQAALDRKVGSPQADVFAIDGEPVAVEKLGSHRVRLTFPSPHPAPLWLINDFAILPEHLLGEAYRQGRLPDAWGPGTDPSEMAGLGPFRLVSHEVARRIVLERNPHYWRRDAADADAVRLPYLDRLIFDVVPDENAELLRFQAGEIDLVSRLAGDRFAQLQSSGNAVAMRDVGPGLGASFLIFNLNDVDLPEVRQRQRWFRDGAFRRAVSLAVDRRSVARLVYGGHATPVVGDLSPSNALYWSAEQSAEAHGMASANLDAAREHLKNAGYGRDAEGYWLDEEGRRLRLTLVANSSNSRHTAIAALLQEDLRRLGLDVTFVGLEFSALVERLTQTFDFDLILLEIAVSLDPNATVPMWRADGGSHFFRLSAEGPPFPWEAEIDRLMREQAREVDRAERRRKVARVQNLIAHEAPLVFLVAPNVLVGAHARLGNFAPSILDHPTLWNIDELFWKAGSEPLPGGSAEKLTGLSPGVR